MAELVLYRWEIRQIPWCELEVAADVNTGTSEALFSYPIATWMDFRYLVGLELGLR